MSVEANNTPELDLIMLQNVLVSVYDKAELEVLVQGLLEVNPEVMFYSTGGTGKKLLEILGPNSNNYTSVEDFTGAPEMQGGRVKTLHPKIHAGLLGKRLMPEHQDYIKNVMAEMTGTPGVYFDILACSVYPFNQTVAKPSSNFRDWIENIDIGGPTMLWASAKNFDSVAILSDPKQYDEFIQTVKEQNGTTHEQRWGMAVDAMEKMGLYRLYISTHMGQKVDYHKDILSHTTFAKPAGE
ncbi:MAG: hypothetical protein KKG59_05010 [Nanoarchaeota archaeon]|nr:hypothetical protein [Nanoarchaeota archaeon]